jgi:hypothetical protein
MGLSSAWVINIVPLHDLGARIGSGARMMAYMKTARTTLAGAMWMAATAATIGFADPAHADPPVGPCDPQQLTVAAGQTDSGLGHRAVWLNFTLQPGAGSCQLSGYPTVDAEVLADGSAPIHAKQTPTGYLGAPVPGGTVTLDPGQGARAMVEWAAIGTQQDPTCQIYGSAGADVRLHVSPPGMSQVSIVPISVGRNEGLCGLKVHPLTAD